MENLSKFKKDSLLKVLINLRKEHCRCGKHCQCQLGGKDIDTGFYYGSQKGAAEIDVCIKIIHSLSENQIKKFIKRQL